jgi:hypothetical protein
VGKEAGRKRISSGPPENFRRPRRTRKRRGGQFPATAFFAGTDYFLQHFAQPAASVQHLAQVAGSLQQLPSHAAFFWQQVEQPVDIRIAATATIASIIIVFILLVFLFPWLVDYRPANRAGLAAT